MKVTTLIIALCTKYTKAKSWPKFWQEIQKIVVRQS